MFVEKKRSVLNATPLMIDQTNHTFVTIMAME